MQAEEILVLKHTEMPESGFYASSSLTGYGCLRVLFKLHSTVFRSIFECSGSLKLSGFDTEASIEQAENFLSHKLETGFSLSKLPLRILVQALKEHGGQFLSEESHSPGTRAQSRSCSPGPW